MLAPSCRKHWHRHLRDQNDHSIEEDTEGPVQKPGVGGSEEDTWGQAKESGGGTTQPLGCPQRDLVHLATCVRRKVEATVR